MTPEQRRAFEEAIWVDPRRMGGTPCFRGTRVPVQSLIDLLEGGETIDQFLELYPSITRQQVLTVLDFATQPGSAPSGSFAHGRRLHQSDLLKFR